MIDFPDMLDFGTCPVIKITFLLIIFYYFNFSY